MNEDEGSATIADQTNICPECGAPVPLEGSCQDNLHSLLFLEYAIPGGPGEKSHFYAVASYGLQHPVSMGYTIETVRGLRDAVADVLSGNASLENIRRRVRASAETAGRVTRRVDDPIPHANDDWTMNVADVLRGGPQEYGERVENWAHAVIQAMRDRDDE